MTHKELKDKIDILFATVHTGHLYRDLLLESERFVQWFEDNKPKLKEMEVVKKRSLSYPDLDWRKVEGSDMLCNLDYGIVASHETVYGV